VKIQGASSNGVRLAGSTAKVNLVHVTGVNLGSYGIFAEDGAQASVDATTTVTGALDDVKSGSLAATTYAALALHQQYDLAPGPAGNSTTFDAQTGSRIFKK
jgi:hypothetical protein